MTLKDSTASINVIMWRYDIFMEKNKSDICKNGDNVTIHGTLKGYPKNGSYNLVVSTIKKNGIGELFELYQKTKEKYEELDYYINKKQIPTHISNVGVLTAIDGAALQDILYVVNNNSFSGNIYVKGCIVQGSSCPLSIALGLQYFEDHPELNLDVVLIARGGGSFEDLMGFSDPIILEKIYNYPIFTISAIGHEVDNMLSDYVADLRAPTPSVAGEIISKYWATLSKILNDAEIVNENLKAITVNKITNKLVELGNIEYSAHNSIKTHMMTRINKYMTQLDDIQNNLNQSIRNKLINYKHRIEKLKLCLDSIDINKILEKGYCLLFDNDGNIINNILNIKNNQKLNIKLIGGEVDITVNTINIDEH
jgi:exodeoxyribonuclease VII large subunit